MKPLMNRAVREAEDVARLEGFTDCEALVSLGLRALAEREDKKVGAAFSAHEVAPVVARHEARAAVLREMALAVSLGQFRTDEYDSEELAGAHRRAGITPEMQSAGGRARQSQLTPERRQELAKQAATARWAKRGE